MSTLPDNAYGSYSGTSMAAPHVTGACALYAALNPGATAAQIKAAILNSTKPEPWLQGKCVTGGRLRVSAY
jgi:subtilisin family serine protease